MSRLIKRKDVGGLNGYYTYTNKGRKYSIVDFGTTMASFTDMIKKRLPTGSSGILEGLFYGWESIELVNDELMTDTIQRADSWVELKKLL